jgi:pimeloyl-ACP methyl ester carboxylesterase
VAAHTALSYPSRVDALILVDAAIYGHGAAEEIVGRVLSTPLMQHVGPLLARIAARLGTKFADSAWHDPSQLTPEIRADYQKQLQADNWDFGFWEAGRVGLPTDLGPRLDEIDLPVLVITGDDDSVVPTEDSIRLAGELPNAELAVIPDCGHVPNEESPDAFLDAASGFLARLAGEDASAVPAGGNPGQAQMLRRYGATS